MTTIALEPIGDRGLPELVRVLVKDEARTVLAGYETRSKAVERLTPALTLRLDEPRTDWPSIDGRLLSSVCTFEGRFYLMAYVDFERDVLVLLIYPPEHPKINAERFEFDRVSRLRTLESFGVR